MRLLVIMVMGLLLLMGSALGKPDLMVTIDPVEDVVVVGLPTPARFDVTIVNRDVTDTFQIYSLIEPNFYPKEFFVIEQNATREFEVSILPRPQSLDEVRGPYRLQYEIKGQETGFYTGSLSFDIIELDDAFSIEVNPIYPGSDSVIVTLRNDVGYDFGEAEVRLTSPFFDEVLEESFGKHEVVQVSVPLQWEGTETLAAGEYAVQATVIVGDVSGPVLGQVRYLEQGGLATSESSEGTIIQHTTVSKTNQGNIDTIAEISIRKSILARLFTVFSEEPVLVEKSGLFVEYTWEQELAPGQSYSVSATSNYTVPFILVVLVVLVVFIVWRMNRQIVTVDKHVSYIKTKGGELALRVRLRVRARKQVESAELIDHIPRIAKLYDQFGKHPDKIDHDKHKIHWEMKTLNAGEERVFTYIMYSKITIVGKLALPAARVAYKHDGKFCSVLSNTTSFLNEKSESHQA